MENRLFVLQRLTAMILAPLVLIHLALILYAIRGGLSADEILSRTEGSVGWALFYGLFVLAAGIHAPIGVRAILIEWTGTSRAMAGWISASLGLLLIWMGFRAVYAVVGGAI